MLISPLFKILGQKLSNFFVGILVQTMAPKGHFEINWPSRACRPCNGASLYTHSIVWYQKETFSNSLKIYIERELVVQYSLAMNGAPLGAQRLPEHWKGAMLGVQLLEQHTCSQRLPDFLANICAKSIFCTLEWVLSNTYICQNACQKEKVFHEC